MKFSFAIAAMAGLAMADVKHDDHAMVGVNIGGWMVLEPWITPSLFYRFLGKHHSEGVGQDQYTFCESLGPEEGNRVLRDHWDYWITEEHIKEMAEKKVEIVRLPLGDWIMKPYGPYVGCTDGAIEKVHWFMEMTEKYGIKVLFDVHGMKDSQNGFDNSGQGLDFKWVDEDHFLHWENEAAYWLGDWDPESMTYKNIRTDHIDWALEVAKAYLQEFGHHKSLYAFQPVNEPWQYSPRDALSDFYRQVREIVRNYNKDLKFVFHTAFDFSGSWNALFPDDDMENVIMDTHYYHAFDGVKRNTVDEWCMTYESDMHIAEMIKYPVWVGEWSLATDACALWLGGFNDNKTPFPYECEWVECPKPYLPARTAVDVDRKAEKLGPFGTNDLSGVRNGMCPRDSTFFSDNEMTRFGHCILDVYDKSVEGQFLWTFRNELEPKWSYQWAYEKGWLNRDAKAEFSQ